MTAPLALAVNHFLVGQHRAQGRAPIHRHLGDIGQPFFIKLQEDPLGPLIVLRIGGVDLAFPVVRKAQILQLPPEAGDILLRSDAGMGAGLDGVLLRRQAVGVPAHRVQHIKTLHALIASDDVGGGVALRVAHVQSRAAGVGEHV